MRFSDLLCYRVVSCDDEPLGKVTDIHIAQDGRIIGTNASYRVDAVVVGRGGLAERLGYVRNRVRGPWMLAAIFRPFEQRAVVVKVRDIAEWDDAERVLRLSPDALAPLPEDRDR